MDLATEEEAALVQLCARAAEELITRLGSIKNIHFKFFMYPCHQTVSPSFQLPFLSLLLVCLFLTEILSYFLHIPTFISFLNVYNIFSICT